MTFFCVCSFNSCLATSLGLQVLKPHACQTQLIQTCHVKLYQPSRSQKTSQHDMGVIDSRIRARHAGHATQPKLKLLEDGQAKNLFKRGGSRKTLPPNHQRVPQALEMGELNFALILLLSVPSLALAFVAHAPFQNKKPYASKAPGVGGPPSQPRRWLRDIAFELPASATF